MKERTLVGILIAFGCVRGVLGFALQGMRHNPGVGFLESIVLMKWWILVTLLSGAVFASVKGGK